MKFKFNNQELFINDWAAEQLETIIYNIRKDWDFFIIITGDRMVRTGKSVLAMNLCAYLAMRLKVPYTIDNIHFDAKEMKKWARQQPPYSIVHYDEARESLNFNADRETQKNILDYFAECGQLNHVFVIVLPDFFELNENIAVARSEILLNVYRKSVKIVKKINNKAYPVVRYDRGQYMFFNRRKKQILYDLAKLKRRKDYGLVPANNLCNFTNVYPIDEQEYRDKKLKYLMRYEDEGKPSGQQRKLMDLRDKLVLQCVNDTETQKEAAKKLYDEYDYKVSVRTIKTIVARAKVQGQGEE